jgi:hypothetical protein
MSVSQMSVGQMSVGQMSVGQMSMLWLKTISQVDIWPTFSMIDTGMTLG